MARITVEDCLVQENNRFALVILAAKRTKQLLDGSPSLVLSKNKSIVTSLREIASGKVQFMTEEEILAEAERKETERLARLAEIDAKAESAPANGNHTAVLQTPALEVVETKSSNEDSDNSDDEK